MPEPLPPFSLLLSDPLLLLLLFESFLFELVLEQFVGLNARQVWLFLHHHFGLLSHGTEIHLQLEGELVFYYRGHVLKIKIMHSPRPIVNLARTVGLSAIKHWCNRNGLLWLICNALFRAFSLLLADAYAIFQGLKAAIFLMWHVILHLYPILREMLGRFMAGTMFSL